MLRSACCLLFAFALTAAAQTPKPHYPATQWPIKDGSFDIHDFRFGTGESLPDLHLHYLTLGTSHQDTAGHTDNAVLLLHGTGGNAHSLLNPASPTSSSGPASPSTSPNTSSSSPTTSATASPASPPTASA